MISVGPKDSMDTAIDINNKLNQSNRQPSSLPREVELNQKDSIVCNTARSLWQQGQEAAFEGGPKGIAGFIAMREANKMIDGHCPAAPNQPHIPKVVTRPQERPALNADHVGRSILHPTFMPAPRPVAPAPRPVAPAPRPVAPAPRPVAPAPRPTKPAPKTIKPAKRPTRRSRL